MTIVTVHVMATSTLHHPAVSQDYFCETASDATSLGDNHLGHTQLVHCTASIVVTTHTMFGVSDNVFLS